MIMSDFRKIVFIAVMLVVCVCLPAQEKPAAQPQQLSAEEQALLQRLYQAQTSDDETEFYGAHKAYSNYLEQRKEWDKYYRTWMNLVIYEVNHKRFHRAFTEIHRLTDDIKVRHQEQYLYLAHMGLGFFYNGRNQPEMGEKYFRRALQSIDVEKDPVAVFNAYLSLAQSLSFKRPAEAMACLDSLPQQMLQNPMYESGVLGYRCIIANKMNDRAAFYRYFNKYDSIREHQPAQFNAANLEQVMVCHHLLQKEYQQAIAWCDSIEVPLTATELRINVFEQMGDWQQAYRARELKDSLELIDERESMEQHLADLSHDIDLFQAEQKKAETRRVQLFVVGLMALAIICLLVGMLVYRHKKNQRLKEQFLLLQEARRRTEASQALRRAFVRTIQEKLKSPVNVLRTYARIFNNPNYLLKPEERPKRYQDILAAAQSIESLMDTMLDSYVRGASGITDEEKQVCINALRSPLLTLINTAELIIDSEGQIPHDEYMQLRHSVCSDAYRVATSTHQLILFSLYGDDVTITKQGSVGLNEMARAILSSYDLHPAATSEDRTLGLEFSTTLSDDVIVKISPLLQELLNCLLDNAGQNATGGTILMSCNADAYGTYAISVSYEGPAISAADAEHIFEPFVQLAAKKPSLGIDLSLAYRLAVSMGYHIFLDSEYTKGVRFVVTGI